jgi:chromate transporter
VVHLKNTKKYWALFISSFQLSAFTFGGGYVIISLMKKKFVEKLQWLDEQEMLDLTAIAQSAPGPIAVNASILIGYRIAGIPGALVTVLGTVLPPFITLSVISFFYQAFRSNTIVGYLMLGMQAGVAAVIADVVYSLVAGLVKSKKILSIIVMIGAFILVYFIKLNIMFIILICGLIGAAETIYWTKKSKENVTK